MNKTKKKPWRWDPIHQQAFDNIKAAIAKETVLAYPDFAKPFEISVSSATNAVWKFTAWTTPIGAVVAASPMDYVDTYEVIGSALPA